MANDGREAVGLSVVLPVYRNRSMLPELGERLTAVLTATGESWELVFVEDGGNDGSVEWITARGTEDRRFRLVSNPRNLGQHATILRGLATARGCRTVVMDADLQDAPEDVPTLLAAWSPGLGAVFASRTRAHQSFARRWTGRIFKRLLRRVAGSRLPVGVGTFVVLSEAARRRVVELADDRPYLPLLLARTGLPLAAVEIRKQQRQDGRSAYSFTRRLALGCRSLVQALRWRLRGR